VSKLTDNLKAVAVALAGGAAITGLWYWVEDHAPQRPAVELDLAELSPALERKPLLKSLPLEFVCKSENSALGKIVCFGEIDTFDGIEARYLAFFFDQSNHLSSLKVAALADQYPQIREHFDARFGPGRNSDGYIAWHTGAGVLTTTAAPPTGAEATLLWVTEPTVVESLRPQPAP
jgi:hypothetical protein